MRAYQYEWEGKSVLSKIHLYVQAGAYAIGMNTDAKILINSFMFRSKMVAILYV